MIEINSHSIRSSVFTCMEGNPVLNIQIGGKGVSTARLYIFVELRHCLRVRYRTSRLRGYGSGTGPLDTDSRGPVPDSEPRL